MTALLITCAACLCDYEPTREDILKGIKVWRLCPSCRSPEPTHSHPKAIHTEPQKEGTTLW